VAEAHRARIEPHGIPGDGCHGDVDAPRFLDVTIGSRETELLSTKNPADFRRVPDMGLLATRAERTADGAGTRFSAISDSDTHTMADVKTADVAGALFTNQ